ncbi:MAG: hypothetical protein JXR05_16015 [Flavobacteriaceae bacterium]
MDKRNHGKIEIRGVVWSNKNKTPIAKALVYLKTISNEIVEEIDTDKEGRFFLKKSNEFSYLIQADYIGSISEQYYIPRNQKSAFLSLYINDKG